MEWVRRIQPSGGHSKFHLLREMRRGKLWTHAYGVEDDTTFAVTFCGELLAEPVDVQQGTIKAGKSATQSVYANSIFTHQRILLPAGRNKKAAHNQCCDSCRLLAASFVDSVAV